MPRPDPQQITFTVDGREVRAPAGMMLADAAQLGDVEIPVFCYEPKLVNPVGACRMCLVEIEGIPKLQTACSTPVKDGMVVHTEAPRVKLAQEAVLEFLLINHPLDCPVCDKGGECPLQDITFGWGPGKTRFIEPKRHFQKPLELSPLIAIDRERCILCYRCVRFSQEVSEDHQLVLLERGADAYVGTFDGHPYVAPFSGNIIELCPVGALTSRAYRFRARPWDIEGSDSVCSLCPSGCNVEYTVRDDRVMRVLARDHAEVDDGWLCDRGRFAYQAVHSEERVTTPLVRRDGELVPAGWDEALGVASRALGVDGGGAAIAGGGTSNEDGFLLQRVTREMLGSPDVTTGFGRALPLELRRALAAPSLQASIPDLEFAHTVLVLDAEPLDLAPVIELRIRKGARHRKVHLAVATSRPSALDHSATSVHRYLPGGVEGFLATLPADLDAQLTGGGADVVVVYSERSLSGERGAQVATALLALADRLGLAGRDGAGLLGLPDEANGRGLREAGVLPNAGPGYGDVTATGRDAPAIAEALISGERQVLHLMGADPLRDGGDRGLWERALAAATVITHETHLTETARRFADVVFPAATGPEQEGTTTNVDGRVQRLRPAIGRPGGVRPTWQVLSDVVARLGRDTGVKVGAMATAQLVNAVPFYAGLTLEVLAGRGVRWPETDAAAALPAGAAPPFTASPPPPAPSANGRLALGTWRSLWARQEVEHSPALRFLAPGQTVELSPEDATRLGVEHGGSVVVHGASGSVAAQVVLRAAVPVGAAFLQTGTSTPEDDGAQLAGDALVEVRRP